MISMQREQLTRDAICYHMVLYVVLFWFISSFVLHDFTMSCACLFVIIKSAEA
jgi:hypothetical protein